MARSCDPRRESKRADQHYGAFRGGRRLSELSALSCRAEGKILRSHAHFWHTLTAPLGRPLRPDRQELPDDMRLPPGGARLEENGATAPIIYLTRTTTNVKTRLSPAPPTRRRWTR